MGLLWDDPSWDWDDTIDWDQSTITEAGGTEAFPAPLGSSRIAARSNMRSQTFN